MEEIIKDFMGVFPNAASKEYCERVIARFEYIQESQGYAEAGTGDAGIWTRQESERIPTTQKENDTYFLGGNQKQLHPERDIQLMFGDMPILQEYWNIVTNCYLKYSKKYGGLDNVHTHTMASHVRVQKTKPGQGYHIWHCDADNVLTSHRLITIALYLNTVDEGGETEFLYQSVRVPPVQGTMILFPTYWTHMHRGNPPLKGNKYFMTTWLQYMDNIALNLQPPE
jgi:hypothetical protein